MRNAGGSLFVVALARAETRSDRARARAKVGVGDGGLETAATDLQELVLGRPAKRAIVLRRVSEVPDQRVPANESFRSCWTEDSSR